MPVLIMWMRQQFWHGSMMLTVESLPSETKDTFRAF